MRSPLHHLSLRVVLLTTQLPGCLAELEANTTFACKTGEDCLPGYVCQRGGDVFYGRCVLDPGTNVCGDGIAREGEVCDDGNLASGDGCSPVCGLEPFHVCQGLECVPVCGDGVVLPREACDDGNTVSGDGCSDRCEIEAGFVCSQPDSQAPSVAVPVVYRDFSDAHPDFETFGGCGHQTGMVEPRLDAEGKPAPVKGLPCVDSEDSFAQWYRDVEGVNATVTSELVLTRSGDTDEFVFDSTLLGDLGGFFPVDDQGLGNEARVHNYHFTSELRAYFVFDGSETLRFRGDDDVWVFINGTLAVDLGGVHSALSADLVLSSEVDPELGIITDPRFDLFEGAIYEIAVFHAERQTESSNYLLALEGFIDAATSTCMPSP